MEHRFIMKQNAKFTRIFKESKGFQRHFVFKELLLPQLLVPYPPGLQAPGQDGPSHGQGWGGLPRPCSSSQFRGCRSRLPQYWAVSCYEILWRKIKKVSLTLELKQWVKLMKQIERRFHHSLSPVSSKACGTEDVYVDGMMDGWTNGWMGRPMNGWVDQWMDGWTNERMGGPMNGWVDQWMDGWTNGWMGGPMDGWEDQWMDAWTKDGWVN